MTADIILDTVNIYLALSINLVRIELTVDKCRQQPGLGKIKL